MLTYARSCAIKSNATESNLGKTLYLCSQAAVKAFGRYTTTRKGKRCNIMKQSYEKPEMAVIVFDTEDVIRTSTPDENEGPMSCGTDF